MAVFFTADFHFGHRAIMEACGRNYSTTAKMDADLVKRYNSVVGDSDKVYVLGDLSMVGSTQKGWLGQIVERMKGRRHLVLGNHDRLSPWDYVEMGFVSVHTALEIDPLTSVFKTVLAHDPAIAEAVRAQWLLCGHVHTLFKEQRNAINVGVDVWDYRPVSEQQIRNLILEKC